LDKGRQKNIPWVRERCEKSLREKNCGIFVNRVSRVEMPLDVKSVRFFASSLFFQSVNLVFGDIGRGFLFFQSNAANKTSAEEKESKKYFLYMIKQFSFLLFI